MNSHCEGKKKSQSMGTKFSNPYSNKSIEINEESRAFFIA